MKTQSDDTWTATGLLGGANVLGHVPNDLDWIRLVRGGLPFNCLVAFGKNLGLPLKEVAHYINVSPTTLARRRQIGHLSPIESERLLRVAKVIAQAIDLFESAETAMEWLREPHALLGGATPISLLDTEIGAKLVARELRSIEYGLPA